MSTTLGSDGSDGASGGATRKTEDSSVSSTRSPSPVQQEQQCEPELIRLCRTRQWNSALSRLNHLLKTSSRAASNASPSASAISSSSSSALLEEVTASYHRQGTALAVSCRYSAPPHVVGALLRAIMLRLDDGGDISGINPLRVNAGGRGTPLHEAIGNEEIDPFVIRMLIQADDDFEERRRRQASRAPAGVAAASERPSSPSPVVAWKAHDALPGPPRAACTQDVDGQIPLHLMVRRVFRACPRPTPSITGQHQAQGDGGRDGRANGEKKDGGANDDVLLATLAELIASYPEGCAVPDRREYEETPLVLALKAQNYASYAASPTGVSDDASTAAGANLEESSHLWEEMLERRIHVVVKLIVLSYPEAARYVASPTSGVGGYTMLHSALFHGRCADTLQLLLSAAAGAGTGRPSSPAPLSSERIKTPKAGSGRDKETGEDHRCHHLQLCLHANSPQGEVPLHFAAMRMDQLPVLHMLTEAAPSAAHCRDQKGRTPLHWLWVRFVSTSLSEVREEPVTFLQMRHVPADYVAKEGRRADEAVRALRWIQKKWGSPPPPRGSSSTPFSFNDGYGDWLELLPSSTESRRHSNGSSSGAGREGAGDEEAETKEEEEEEEEEASVTLEQARVVLFWSKMQILLRAAASSRSEEAEVPPMLFPPQKRDKEEDRTKIVGTIDSATPATTTVGSTILHDASSLSCCPRSVARIAASVHRDFLSKPDSRGRLPLHCAAGRMILPWRPHLSFSSSFSFYSTSSSRAAESALGTVLEAYPAAARLYDRQGRLPIHHAIDAYQRSIEYHGEAASHWAAVVGDGGPLIGENDHDPLDHFRPLLRAHPESIERRDGATKLYPFMQAACSDADSSSVDFALVSPGVEARQLTVVYGLLRVYPSLVSSGIVSPQSSSPSSSSSVAAEVAGASFAAASAGTACSLAVMASSLPGDDPTSAACSGDTDVGMPEGKRRRLDT